MGNNKPHQNISAARIYRLKEQGYFDCTDQEIAEYAVGNRFAYQLCLLLLVVGLLLESVPILGVLMGIALLAVVLPYHPFDYLYNYGLRHLLNRPKLPPRSPQAKFACGIGAVLIGVVIYMFSVSLFLWGYIVGGIVGVVALLVSSIDLCIPSMIYNALFGK